MYSARDDKKIRQTFPTLSAAKGWRNDALSDLGKGKLRAASPTTLREAAEAFIAGAKDGTIRQKSGQPFKSSTIRAYEQAFRDRVLDDLGALKLANVRRLDLQDLADRMLAKGLDPSTVRNAIMPLRAIYRRAVSRNDVAVKRACGAESCGQSAGST